MNLDVVVRDLKEERDRLDRAITALTGVSNHKSGKRIMSAEARERIAAAQRKRWALTKKAKKL